MVLIGCPETSVINYQSTLRYITEERRSNLHRGKNLKSRKCIRVLKNWSLVCELHSTVWGLSPEAGCEEWILGFHKKQGISLTPQGQLSSHEGLCVTALKTLTQQPLTMNRSRAVWPQFPCRLVPLLGTFYIPQEDSEQRNRATSRRCSVLSTSDKQASARSINSLPQSTSTRREYRGAHKGVKVAKTIPESVSLLIHALSLFSSGSLPRLKGRFILHRQPPTPARAGCSCQHKAFCNVYIGLRPEVPQTGRFPPANMSSFSSYKDEGKMQVFVYSLSLPLSGPLKLIPPYSNT